MTEGIQWKGGSGIRLNLEEAIRLGSCSAELSTARGTNVVLRTDIARNAKHASALAREAALWLKSAERDSLIIPLLDWGAPVSGGACFLSPRHESLHRVDEQRALSITRYIAAAVSRIGSVHGNLSVESVFFTDDETPVVGGWGSTRLRNLENGATERDDVVALAKIMYFLIAGKEYSGGRLRLDKSVVSGDMRKLLRRALDGDKEFSLLEFRYDIGAAMGDLPVCTRALPPNEPKRRKDTLLNADLNSVNGSISRRAAELNASLPLQAPVVTPRLSAGRDAAQNRTEVTSKESIIKSETVAPAAIVSKETKLVSSSSSVLISDAVSALLEPHLEPVDVDKLQGLVQLCNKHPSVIDVMFKTMFKHPMGKDPIVAFKGLTLLHTVLQEGPAEATSLAVVHDGFLGWVEASWSRERIQSRPPHKAHRLSHCFAVGELGWYASFLRRRAAFFSAYKAIFSSRWTVRIGALQHTAENNRALRVALSVLEGTVGVLKRAVSCSDPAELVKTSAIRPLTTDIAYAYRACCWLYATAPQILKSGMEDDLDSAHHATRSVFRTVSSNPTVLSSLPPHLVLHLDEAPPRNLDGNVLVKAMQALSTSAPSAKSNVKKKKSKRQQKDGIADSVKVESAGSPPKEKVGTPLSSDGETEVTESADTPSDESETSKTKAAKSSSKKASRRQHAEKDIPFDKAPPKRKPPVIVKAPVNGQSGNTSNSATEDRQGSKEALAAAASGKKTPMINRSFEVAPYEVQFGPQIGSGGFGVVHKAKFRGQTVAVKKIHAHALSNVASISEFQSEVAVLCTLKHPNILAFMGACTKPPNLMIITEFMARGTLFDVLHQSQMRITWPMRRKFALDTCRGMRYLHDSKLLHRDLKSSNLMLDNDFNCKVGDFGLTRTSSGTAAVQMTGQCGTFQYMAVEVLANKPYSEKADVFSFGVLLWEMVARKLPYFGMQPMQVGIAVVQQGLRPTIPPKTPAPLSKLMQSCWDNDPNRRPSFAQLVQMLEAMPQ